MHYAFTEMDEDSARRIQAWRYDGPYAVYDPGPGEETLQAFLDPRNAYYAISDEAGDLVAYACFGPDARVPGGDYDDAALDVGLGMRPDLTGRGLGLGMVEAILDFARGAYAPTAFRLTVAAFNRRALRVYQRAGFRLVQAFAHTQNGKLFVLLVRAARGTRAVSARPCAPRCGPA